MGPEMQSATLAEWLVADGEVVEVGQAVATIETEKVTTDLQAPEAGEITLLVEAGADYPVGTVLAVMGAGAGSPRPASESPTPESTVAPETVVVAAGDNGRAALTAEDRARLTTRRRGEPLATPVARRMAAALCVALGDIVVPPGQRAIRKHDVEQAAVAAVQQLNSPPAPAVAPAPPGEPLTPMRRRIAQRMHESLRDTAQITDFREHEVSGLIALRKSCVTWSNVLGFRPSFTDLFVRVTALALRDVPALNASMTDDDRIVTHDEINIGVAVALPEGLIVPVLRNADQLDVATIHTRLTDLVGRAREGQLALDEVSGGTFTVTNLGSYGSHTATPILVGGQVGILGTGTFLERPVVRDGTLQVGTVMHTSLTIDHRVVDGQTAGDFQSAWGRLVSDPGQLL
jgi:pyruvate dehydrogenase E2 component (dihydrolipoamide acetyltransferase)